METEMTIAFYLVDSLELFLLPHKIYQKISRIIAVPLLWDYGDIEMKLLMTTSWK